MSEKRTPLAAALANSANVMAGLDAAIGAADKPATKGPARAAERSSGRRAAEGDGRRRGRRSPAGAADVDEAGKVEAKPRGFYMPTEVYELLRDVAAVRTFQSRKTHSVSSVLLELVEKSRRELEREIVAVRGPGGE